MRSEECLTLLKRFPVFDLAVKTSISLLLPCCRVFAVEELWFLLARDQEELEPCYPMFRRAARPHKLV
jgi:hypothetical protein